METQPVRLINIGLRCNCNKALLILANEYPRPGLYVCPSCSETICITIEEVSDA